MKCANARRSDKNFSEKGLLFLVLGFIFRLSLKELLTCCNFFLETIFSNDKAFLFFRLKHPFLKRCFCCFQKRTKVEHSFLRKYDYGYR